MLTSRSVYVLSPEYQVSEGDSFVRIRITWRMVFNTSHQIVTFNTLIFVPYKIQVIFSYPLMISTESKARLLRVVYTHRAMLGRTWIFFCHTLSSLAFFNFEGLGDVGSTFNLLPVTELSAESVESTVDNDWETSKIVSKQ